MEPHDNTKNTDSIPIFPDQKPIDETQLVWYDFDPGSLLNVPVDWNSQKENLRYYEGGDL